MDLFSILPMDLLFKNMGSKFNQGLRIARITKLYKMIRLLRLARVLKMYNKESTKSMQNQAKIQTAYMRTAFFIGGLAVLIHILASAWISIGLAGERTWLTEKINALRDAGEPIEFPATNTMDFDSYMISLYFTIQTITTVGYGDINPTNTKERIFVCFLMFAGASAFSLAAG